MQIAEASHYLLTLAQNTPGGAGAAIRTSVLRLIEKGEYDALYVVALTAQLAETEAKMDRLIAEL